MPSKKDVEDELAARFMDDLSETLDLDKTAKKLNISLEDARGLLKAISARISGPHPGPRHPEAVVALAAAHAHEHAAQKGLYHIYVDGASRGNPGKAGAGAVIKNPDGTIARKLKSYLGIVTNNTAEYGALIMALEAARSMHIKEVSVFADSELMVRQINGQYKVKSEDLRPLFNKAAGLIAAFEKFRISHVPREKNSIADGLANEAIDTHAR